MRLGWHSRGYLPHFEAGEQPQFLTWRLADSLPKTVLDQWVNELERLPESERKRALLKRTGPFLDAGEGSCLLRNPSLARIVQDGLIQNHTHLYRLHCWVVMPNHVHAILAPFPGHSLGEILQKLKGGSARRINLERGRSGTVWHPDYMDKRIKDEAAFERIRLYIEWNPVKAGLCHEPKAWPFSSAAELNQERLHVKTREQAAKD